MVAAKRSRYLAPVALLAALVATIAVVNSGLHSSRHSTATRPPASVDTRLPATHRPDTARRYVVKAGDTLSQIALRTGVAVARLERLNPGVDPNTLQTGQRLRLR